MTSEQGRTLGPAEGRLRASTSDGVTNRDRTETDSSTNALPAASSADILRPSTRYGLSYGASTSGGRRSEIRDLRRATMQGRVTGRRMTMTALGQATPLLGEEHTTFQQEPSSGSENEAAAPPPAVNSKMVMGMLLALNLYFDSSIPLWQQLNKQARIAKPYAEGCNKMLDQMKKAGLKGGDLENEEIWASESGKKVETVIAQENELDEGMQKWEECPEGEESKIQNHTEWKLDENTNKCKRLVKFSSSDCAWFYEHKRGVWKKRPHTFTTGCALFVQAGTGCMIFWTFNFLQGGMTQLQMCFRPWPLLSFFPIGMLFGFAAVFSFLAQKELSPGSYSLYAQTGIVLVPIMWRIIFNKALACVTWIHISLIAAGILMYRLSEMGGEDSQLNMLGLVWVFLKVLASGGASVWAESFLKSDTGVPFAVQVTYIMPWKALTCLSTVWILPPHGLPSDRPGGFFHDWTPLTVIIIFTNLGDTIMSAVIAKTFDSVVKAICGVFGIIFPTWIISFLVGWETLDMTSPVGKLKASGGVIVIISSFAYVVGRAQSAELDKLKEEKEAKSEEPQELEMSERLSASNVQTLITSDASLPSLQEDEDHDGSSMAIL